MTPTPTFILLVSLFWTLPATAAVLTYRRHDSSVEKMKASLQETLERAFGQAELQPQADT